jgi:hypothetical protein
LLLCFIEYFPIGLPLLLLCPGSQLPTGLVNLLLEFEEEVFHVTGPGLFIVCGGPLQFAQVMGMAQGMLARIVKIRFPMVMAQHAFEQRENADGLDAASGMRTNEFYT